MERSKRQSECGSVNSKTNQDFFTKLPTEIIINILSRLPFRTIVSCKCVCKSLLKFVESREFVLSRFSESVSVLAVLEVHRASRFKFYEIKDVLNVERREFDQNCLLAAFSLPYRARAHGSAKGLFLLLGDGECAPNGLCICNPITRDYVKLPPPPQEPAASEVPAGTCEFRVRKKPLTYGFGASRMTGEYKVVVIYEFMRNRKPCELQRVPRFECQVYTLGTGTWRRIDLEPAWERTRHLDYNHLYIGEFLNGNLHWMIYDAERFYNVRPRPLEISCFDLETELFSTFPLPPLDRTIEYRWELFSLQDCLCVYGNSPGEEMVIWLMKEYGVEESWTIIWKKRLKFYHHSIVRPVKILGDGDLLMAVSDCFLVVYSDENKIVRIADVYRRGTIDSVLHTPSFLSLKSFEMENVESF